MARSYVPGVAERAGLVRDHPCECVGEPAVEMRRCAASGVEEIGVHGEQSRIRRAMNGHKTRAKPMSGRCFWEARLGVLQPFHSKEESKRETDGTRI